MNYFGKEKEGSPPELRALQADEGGRESRAAIQYNFGAGRAGADSPAGAPWPGRGFVSSRSSSSFLNQVP